METNKIDKNIQKKFVNRTFKPSNSAWERLSAQLDEQPKQKKNGWFFFYWSSGKYFVAGFNRNSIIF